MRPACRPLPRACWSLSSPGVLAALAASPEDTIQGPDAPAPAQSQWDRRGPDRRPRADRLEALHPFLFSEAPTCPPNRQGRGGGIGGGAGRCALPPHPLQGDSHSFPLTAPPLQGNPPLVSSPGLPASSAPRPERGSVQNRNPLALSSPFPLHPHPPHFLSRYERGFLRRGGEGSGRRRARIPQGRRACRRRGGGAARER